MHKQLEETTARFIRKAHASVFAIAVLFLLPISPRVFAQDQEQATTEERKQEIDTLLRGSTLFHRTKCRVCHSYGATGKKGPSLVDDKWLHGDGSLPSIRKIIQSGIEVEQMKGRRRSGPMPPASDLEYTDDEIDAVARYVYEIGRLPRTDDGKLIRPTATSKVLRRELLLVGCVRYHKSGCVKCHYSGARGGSVHGGPSLVDEIWHHCDGSAAGIKRVMLTGVAAEQVKGAERREAESSMPAAKDLGVGDADVDVIAAYLHAIGERK